VAQEVEHQPSKHEALSSNSSAIQKKTTYGMMQSKVWIKEMQCQIVHSSSQIYLTSYVEE
jgi:hypothetical protein